MNVISFQRSLIIAAILSVLLTMGGCYGFFESANARAVSFRGPLKVALHHDLLIRSLEKDLINDFARAHLIKVKFVPFHSIEQAEDLLNSAKVDLAFPRTSLKNSDFLGRNKFNYDDLKLSVVCPGKLAKSNELLIPNYFSYITTNKHFAEKFGHLSWSYTNLAANDLKNKVLKNNELCYVTDSRIASKQAQNFPYLRVVWTAAKSDSVSWVTRPDLKELNQLIHTWFQNLVRKKQLRKFWDRYEAVEFKMTVLEHRRFEKDMATKLPQWKKLFQNYAKENQIPWTLLAAVAYQESKWNEDAVSHTGVRGLMQLTENTAKQVGVSDRKDPRESIRGGAYYLKYLYGKTPAELNPYERWAQALSAYNMGWAHLRDARILAKRLNTDSTRWAHFKKVIPLLEQPNYYLKLSFGSARGSETVDFVEQVLGYTELLNATVTRPSLTSQDF